MIVKLKNGGVMSIISYESSMEGSDDCDYGSIYTNYFDVELTNNRVTMEVSQMYNHALPEYCINQLIKDNNHIVQSMTEEEFVEFVKSSVTENIEDIEWSKEFRNLYIDCEIRRIEHV